MARDEKSQPHVVESPIPATLAFVPRTVALPTVRPVLPRAAVNVSVFSASTSAKPTGRDSNTDALERAPVIAVTDDKPAPDLISRLDMFATTASHSEPFMVCDRNHKQDPPHRVAYSSGPGRQAELTSLRNPHRRASSSLAIIGPCTALERCSARRFERHRRGTQ